MPIPKLFECLSKILLFGSTLEFLCAQSPYSMKGLLFGMLYANCSVFVVLTYIGFLPFHFEVGHINWAYKGCGFWFFVAYLGVSLILTTLFTVMNCTYKKRQRSETLPSEHYFAEGYYDHSDPVVECMHDASS